MTGRPAGPLRIGGAEVWQINLDPPAADLSHYLPFLSAGELARAARLGLPELRARFVVARGALREVLSQYVGRSPGELELIAGRLGKPELPGGPRFNLSHSAGLALCAVVCNRSVGVDLEHYREVPEAIDIAQRWLAPADGRVILEALPASRSEVFLRQWTRQEAYLKALGIGLSGDLAAEPINSDLWEVHEFCPRPGFFAALVLEGHPCLSLPGSYNKGLADDCRRAG